MFGRPDSPLQIGDANVQAVLEKLADANIRVATKDVIGTKGRRITFDCATGNLRIEIVGTPQKTI